MLPLVFSRGATGPNMYNRLRRIIAGLAIVLGAAHIIYGIISIKSFTAELIWFSGAGIAMILAGHANLDKARAFPSILMLVYTILMVIKLPLRQVFFGLGLFAVLSFFAVFKSKINQA